MKIIHTTSSVSQPNFHPPSFFKDALPTKTYLLIWNHDYEAPETEVLEQNLGALNYREIADESGCYLVFSNEAMGAIGRKVFDGIPSGSKGVLVLISDSAAFPKELLKKKQNR